MQLVVIAEDKQEEIEKAHAAVTDAGMMPAVLRWTVLYDVGLGLGFPFKQDWKLPDGPTLQGSIGDWEEKLGDKIEVGVITDIMMPVGDSWDSLTEEEPVGIATAALCCQRNIPVVMCSDLTGRHTPQTWVFSLLRIQIGEERTEQILVRDKNWGEAVRRLKAQMDAAKE